MGRVNENLRRPDLPPPLRIEFEGGEEMPLRAIVSGEIDYAGAFSMQVRIAAACRRYRARGLILDLESAELMGSSGLAAILNLQREPACQRGGMVLSRPSRQARRILALTGLDRRLIVGDTIEQAETLLLYSAAGGDVSRRHPHTEAIYN
jgi:anti-anti-sigma factor